jgi:hypothetical protein
MHKKNTQTHSHTHAHTHTRLLKTLCYILTDAVLVPIGGNRTTLIYTL